LKPHHKYIPQKADSGCPPYVGIESRPKKPPKIPKFDGIFVDIGGVDLV
jgi:hypothetical protein